MSFTPDPRVDAHIASLVDWRQSICREVRELVRGLRAQRYAAI